MKKILFLFCGCTFLLSCKKFLDIKSDKENVVPSSLQDAQAILDNYQLMNHTHGIVAAQSDDDFYLTDSYFNSLSEANQNVYSWATDVVGTNDWRAAYNIVLAANTALETIEKIQPSPAQMTQWKTAKGSALFVRAYSFLETAQVFAEPYDKNTAAQKPGIPLKLTSDLNEPVFRSSVRQTYDRIIADLKEAAELLPPLNPPASRPAKPAAFATLARTYLFMQEYQHAGKYADSCLQLHDFLLDYNTLNAASPAPFARFNPETIYHANMGTTTILGVNNMKIDSLLYNSYHVNDLRRSLFFQSNGIGTVGFKGSYEGNTNSGHFNGIATDEMLLVRAEASARAGYKDSAMTDLNRLLKTRWKTGLFIPYTAANENEALLKVLEERRKELVIRGLRWHDLRRLNKEPDLAKTLVRKINNQIYQLPPNDPRYTFYIPLDVIALSGMQQNIR